MDVDAECPYCGEPVTIFVDPGKAEVQRYFEDCAVCCRPWEVHVVVDEAGQRAVVLERQDA
jgi:formate dehydrogenase maturation protein FdhE